MKILEYPEHIKVGSETGPLGVFLPHTSRSQTFVNYNQGKPHLQRKKAEVEVKEVSSKNRVTLWEQIANNKYF